MQINNVSTDDLQYYDQLWLKSDNYHFMFIHLAKIRDTYEETSEKFSELTNDLSCCYRFYTYNKSFGHVMKLHNEPTSNSQMRLDIKINSL